MFTPSFIGIGAQKCASTWIYDILKDHPQVRLSEQKELDFFSYRFEQGYLWYGRQFGQPDGAVTAGEVSPSYFHEPAVPERVRRYSPEAKIILSLRDPVERALSQHRHAVRTGGIADDDLSFESALSANPTYLEQGLYATHLTRWLDWFPKQQILVLFFEDIVGEPDRVARLLYQFLEIDSEHHPEHLNQRSNVSHVTPHTTLERARKALRMSAGSIGLGKAWEYAAKLGARHLYHKLNRRPSEEVIPPVSPTTINELRTFFREEMVRLEKLTGRDLTNWR
ncbi:MAG: sulfotransferase domain-containing protein [Chromatiales bacterium]|nr:sulfotransferase domain-containing protein [Chromatiales bacterium]